MYLTRLIPGEGIPKLCQYVGENRNGDALLDEKPTHIVKSSKYQSAINPFEHPGQNEIFCVQLQASLF
jgi:hypothetical protein